MVSQALSKPFDSFKTIALQYLLAAAPFVAEHLDIGDTCEILKIAVTQYTVEQKAMPRRCSRGANDGNTSIDEWSRSWCSFGHTLA